MSRDDESDGSSDGEAIGRAPSCAPPSEGAKGTHEQWLREAATSLSELADSAGKDDLVQSCLTATEKMLTQRAEGIDHDIAKVATAAAEGVQSAMAGLSFVQLQTDVTTAKLEQVNAAIKSIEEKAQERHQSQMAELGKTLEKFGESFKTHLSVEQLRHAQHVESTMKKFTAQAEMQQASLRTYVTEQIADVQGEMKHTIQKDVPNFVGAMITETVKGGPGGMRPPDGGGRKAEFADTLHPGNSSSRPSCKHSLVGYVVLDATRGETETDNQPQLTIPMPILSHVVSTVVAQGTPDLFKTAVLDSIETIPSEEPLTSLPDHYWLGTLLDRIYKVYSWFFKNKGRSRGRVRNKTQTLRSWSQSRYRCLN